MKLLLILLLSLTVHAAHRITDHGAIPNDGISDADAIREAIHAAQEDCGGDVVIPRGEFLLDESVYSDFTECGYVHLTIRGETGAEMRLSVGAGNVGLNLTSMNSLQVTDITFLGVNAPPTSPLFTDAGTAILISTIDTVKFDHVYFYGVAVDGAVIRVFNSHLVVTNSQFAGGTAYAHTGAAYILGDNDGTSGNGWQSIRVENCQFLDYVNYKTSYISKTPQYMSGAYIKTGSPSPYGAAKTRGKLEVKNTIMDEGSSVGVWAVDTPFVEIDGLSVNLNLTPDAAGIKLIRVKHATIDQSVAEWGTGSYFLVTQDSPYVKVNGIECRSGTNFWKNLGNSNVFGYYPECPH